MPLYVLYVVLRFGFSAQNQEMKTMKFFVQTLISEKKIVSEGIKCHVQVM